MAKAIPAATVLNNARAKLRPVIDFFALRWVWSWINPHEAKGHSKKRERNHDENTYENFPAPAMAGMPPFAHIGREK